MDSENALVVFQGKQIRRTWHNDGWYFSVVDVVKVLTESADAKDYWYRLKKRESESSGIELSTICRQLKLISSDGKLYETDCANTESMFRIIQSIPSKKAEPFKRWLAKVGYERVQEIENPEISMKRMRDIYKSKGYSDDWIEKRARGIAIRDELTDEWKKRGVKEGKEFAILTSEISKATFGLTPSNYKKLKGLGNETLRDHMTDLELIFSMLGERATTEITRNRNARGYQQSKLAAKKGGSIAGDARRKLEIESGRKVVNEENYLSQPEKIKKLERKR